MNKLRALSILGILSAISRHFVNSEVIEALKAACIEALEHDEWERGEKTEFVIASVRDLVASTPSPWDDMIISVVASIYLARYDAQNRE